MLFATWLSNLIQICCIQYRRHLTNCLIAVIANWCALRKPWQRDGQAHISWRIHLVELFSRSQWELSVLPKDTNWQLLSLTLRPMGLWASALPTQPPRHPCLLCYRGQWHDGAINGPFIYVLNTADSILSSSFVWLSLRNILQQYSL